MDVAQFIERFAAIHRRPDQAERGSQPRRRSPKLRVSFISPLSFVLGNCRSPRRRYSLQRWRSLHGWRFRAASKRQSGARDADTVMNRGNARGAVFDDVQRCCA
jgi:hypothetical protein